MVDKRALKILLGTFWSSGWKEDRSIGGADFEYAKAHGMMFDPVVLTHDDIVERLLAQRGRVQLSAVAAAFLASLSTRRLDVRSALGSHVFALHFPDHSLSVTPETHPNRRGQQCLRCGRYAFREPKSENLSVLNFERHKWGGVRRDNPLYAWLDLRLFEQTEPVEPSETDRQILRQILNAAASLPDNARPNLLVESLKDVVRSNKAERKNLIETLSLCGILQPAGRPGYLDGFTEYRDRAHTGEHYNDWGYPAIWWRGSDGVNRDAVSRIFPDL